MNLQIRPLREKDISLLDDRFYFQDDGYFQKCFELQEQDKRTLFLGLTDNKVAGYVILNYQPKYKLYQIMNIPEIQDLNILEDHRRNGYGTALLKYCELAAIKKSYKSVGISVGLNEDFGSAQKLYIQNGYVPDGYGATYDRISIANNRQYPVDDDLCLMLIKTL